MNNIDITKQYSGENSPEVITYKSRGKTFRYVPYNVKKLKDKTYTWNYVFVGPSGYNYDGLVNAIIGIKYTLDKMLAILNNYLYDSENKTYKQEFNDMQNWRILAKKYAKEHFKI